MPLYEYKCPECDNEFNAMMTLEEYTPLHVCPDCNSPAPRKISAPQLKILKKHERVARERNEKSIYEPLKVTRQHQCSHDSCEHDHGEKKKGAFQQVSQGSRPWMLG